ncbi:MAG TPA: phenylalanine--tRNA ligase subunit alpha, partial [Steroidobacteraceae bacterium]
MLENLQTLIETARADIASCRDLQALEEVRVRLLGKKGEITALLKSLGAMEPEARKQAGARINEAKETLTALLEERRQALEAEKLAAQLASETVDVTLPGRGQSIGGLHPVTRVRRRLEQIFRNAGFTVAD